MQNNELNEVGETIRDLINKTETGQMDWVEANKTTFVWSNEQDNGRLVLQRIGEGPRLIPGEGVTSVPGYQLQAIDPNTRRVGFTVNSDEVKELRSIMGELFEVAQSTRIKKAISFLKSIVP